MENVPEVSPELPTRAWRLMLAMLGKLPQRAMSRSFGRIADVSVPVPARARIYTAFARAVGIDLSEVEYPLDEYPTLNTFFVRRLRPGARSWPKDSSIITSPVDGIVGRLGRVQRGRALQAKGHDYSLSELLGDRTPAAEFENGSFVTIYLSPRHYHRIHTPIPGTIPRAVHLPGDLLPVNAPAVMHVPGLFVRNERLICYVDGVAGRIAVVAVGAYNVGRISAAFDDVWDGTGDQPWVTNRRSPTALSREYDPPIEVEGGAEIMAFHLGSTVVLLFGPRVALEPDLAPGAEVRAGQRIGIADPAAHL